MALGNYYSTDSRVHQLDPRTKLIVVFVVTCSLFLNDNLFSIICWAAFLALGIKFSNTPLKVVFQNFRFLVLLFAITFIINALFGQASGGVVVEWFGFPVFLENVYLASLLCLRLAVLVMFISLFTLTTSPLEITDAIVWGTKPFAARGFPALELALILSLAMRFIPIIQRDAERLRKAQLSRGAGFTGSMLQKIRALAPLTTPLLLSLFHRAEEISEAMAARCYSKNTCRSRLRRFQWTRNEALAIGLVLTLLATINLNSF